jgi:hypothetical protein
MYASVRKYSVDPERVDELMHRVDERFAPRLAEMPGFVAYQAIDAGVDRAGESTVFAVTICSNREAADRSAEVAAEFVRDESRRNGGRPSRSGHRSSLREPRRVRGARDGSRLATRLDHACGT